ncbi:SpoIIE family protein phosphatase [Picosynechococcus sp. NKBG15041c]|uniref:SpoIIE family protein phosphatase n=1 Tax=Picosynechococcus sp. NKBG15041c TaxID=1407650 RepID=UPI00041003EC|nr:SpoIIE family protein phosphatase [Picosynechococcus sp. NKBG15041c]
MTKNNIQTETLYQLLSLIRHELRTPINAIIGYAEIVQEDLEEIESSSAKKCNYVIDQAHELLEIINNLLVSDKKSKSESFLLKECFSKVLLLMAPSIENIFLKISELRDEIIDEELIQDLEKIQIATTKLKNLVYSLESIYENFQDSLKIENTTFNISNDFFEENTEDVLNQSTQKARRDLLGRILVVDDNQANVDLLERQLTRQGHQVTTCLSAKLAIDILEQHLFDIILLDVIMPEVTGYEFLKFLKSHTEFQFIPVVMISALDDFQHIVQCIQIGAEDYLPKPCDPVLLKARIEASLERKKLRDKEVLYTHQLETLSSIMQNELDKGRQMQKNFLPSEIPNKKGWEFSTFFSPAKQLSGDFYDLFELPNDAIGIVVADVCDKGVGAALFMGLFRSLIRIFSGQTLLDGLHLESHKILDLESLRREDNYQPALEAISLANNYVALNHGDTGMFATIFFGVLDTKTGIMKYVSGGHEPAFLLDSQGNIKQVLNSTGPAVGMMVDLPFQIQEVEFKNGDLFCVYTDGIPESKSITGSFYGMDHLKEMMLQTYDSADHLVQNITGAVIKHIGEAEQFDDITVVGIRRGF